MNAKAKLKEMTQYGEVLTKENRKNFSKKRLPDKFSKASFAEKLVAPKKKRKVTYTGTFDSIYL